MRVPVDVRERVAYRLQGLRNDPLFPLEHGEALAREIPDAELLVVRDAGHGVPPERAWPELVARVTALTSGR